MTAKVWEETWSADLHGNACECSSRVTTDALDGDDAAVFFANDGGRARALHPRLLLAAAAPEMARLLLEAQWAAGASWGPSGDDCEHKGMACFFCDGLEVPMQSRHIKHPTPSGHAADCRLVTVLRKAGVLQASEAPSPTAKDEET